MPDDTVATVTQKFRDLMADKSAAKQLVLAALGRAKFADSQGKDSAADWAIVDAQGVNGAEGQAMASAQALADAAVAEHPEWFATLAPYATRGSEEQLVKLVRAFKAGGFRDEATLVQMFELATFERQQIGMAAHPALRVAGGKG